MCGIEKCVDLVCRKTFLGNVDGRRVLVLQNESQIKFKPSL
jgi:hypothetical protein